MYFSYNVFVSYIVHQRGDVYKHLTLPWCHENLRCYSGAESTDVHGMNRYVLLPPEMEGLRFSSGAGSTVAHGTRVSVLLRLYEGMKKWCHGQDPTVVHGMTSGFAVPE